MKPNTITATVLTALAILLPGLAPPARAQVAGAPAYVDYQGMVYRTTGEPLGSSGSSPGPYSAAPQNYTMQFKIYSAQSEGDLIWAETQTVTVSLGAFSVRLGSGVAIPGLLALGPPQASIANAFNGTERFLELTVVIPPAATGTPITPRLAFQSSPFSFVAQRAKEADKATSVEGVVTATGGTFAGTFNAAGGTFTGGAFTGGTFGGDGAGLTGLNASNLTGNLPDGLLGNVALLNRSPQQFTGAINSFAGKVGVGTAAPTAALHVMSGGLLTTLMVSSSTGGTVLNLLNTSAGGREWTIISSGSGDGSGPGKLIFRDPNSGNGMIINQAGNVGIGNTDPTYAKLVVMGTGGSHNIGNHKFFNSASGITIETSTTGTHSDASIYANGAIEAGTYRAFSDARIKDIHGRSDGILDLATLMAIGITNYTYRDGVEKGRGAQKKVIAQQVEGVYPQVVSKSTNVVPDIYKKAPISDGWVQLATGLKKGERVRLIAEKTEGIHEVLEVQAGKFRTAFVPEGDKVFVYGREVNDFRVVDYEAIAMLNVSATQQIKKEKDIEIKLRDEKIAALEKRLSALEKKDSERDRKLAEIAQLLHSAQKGAAHPVLLNAGVEAR